MAEIIDGQVVETITKTTGLADYINRRKGDLSRMIRQGETLAKQQDVVAQQTQEIITELESIITQIGEQS